MATGDKYIECDSTDKILSDSSGLLELLNACLVKTAAGEYGLRTQDITASAGNISQVVTCSDDLRSPEQLLREIIVEDADGKPAIGLVHIA